MFKLVNLVRVLMTTIFCDYRDMHIYELVMMKILQFASMRPFLILQRGSATFSAVTPAQTLFSDSPFNKALPSLIANTLGFIAQN